jgi:hypothetical protein
MKQKKLRIYFQENLYSYSYKSKKTISLAVPDEIPVIACVVYNVELL